VSEIVIDASAALSFLLPSQVTGAAMQFLANRDSDGFVAPYVFAWEVSNVLVRLRLRGLLTAGAYQQAFDDLAELDISLAGPQPADQIVALGELAAGEGIRLFDAAYLALAIDRRGALASRDDRLLEVARRCVPSFDLRGDRLP
jgi:predicted nucleic acid-binding protein